MINNIFDITTSFVALRGFSYHFFTKKEKRTKWCNEPNKEASWPFAVLQKEKKKESHEKLLFIDFFQIEKPSYNKSTVFCFFFFSSWFDHNKVDFWRHFWNCPLVILHNGKSLVNDCLWWLVKWQTKDISIFYLTLTDACTLQCHLEVFE